MSDKIMKAFAKMLEKTMNPLPNHCVECDKPTIKIIRKGKSCQIKKKR